MFFKTWWNILVDFISWWNIISPRWLAIGGVTVPQRKVWPRYQSSIFVNPHFHSVTSVALKKIYISSLDILSTSLSMPKKNGRFFMSTCNCWLLGPPWRVWIWVTTAYVDVVLSKYYWLPKVQAWFCIHGNLRGPSPRPRKIPRNKALMAGLIKGQRWFIVPS